MSFFSSVKNFASSVKDAVVEGKDKIKNAIVKNVNDATPAEIPKESVFLKDGRLTPGEFTAACDRLILASKMWSWQPASKGGFQEPVLDPKKQYLKTTTVSRCRLSDDTTGIQAIKIDEEWQSIGVDQPMEKKEFKEEDAAQPPVPVSAPKIKKFTENSDDEDQVEAKDDAKPAEEVEDTKRVYEVHITYDRHYLTPRLWLTGVNSKNRPLTKEEIMEEVMPEYREKTVTYDQQPQTGEFMANIHPCRHANVLKTFAEQAMSNGGEVRPDQSLFLFLKFISSVMPTVEIDFTVEMQL